MNEQSLQRVNSFLAAVASRTEVGAVLDVTPAELGRELGFPDPLSTARAVRALIARKRLEAAMGSYRLLDPSPVAADEKEAISRPRRRGIRGRRADGASRVGSERAAYSDLGRAVVDKLIDAGKENSVLRAELRTTREELRSLRVARDDAEHRAQMHAEKHRELEHRAEMAEANLRTLLATARGREPQPRADGPVSDSEMEAILGVLKANGENDEAATGLG
jgi:hypothetical protein